jgi:TonB family protein
MIPNRYLSLPQRPFELGPEDRNPIASSGPIGDKPGTNGGDKDLPRQSTEIVKKPDPPTDPLPPAPARPRFIGVANGYATFLPKPPYPPPAMAVNAQGKVDVQITIDEDGHVISAKAINGHPLLRLASEDAARKARFKPTTLSNVPVKVTGVIVYNFTRN